MGDLLATHDAELPRKHPSCNQSAMRCKKCALSPLGCQIRSDLVTVKSPILNKDLVRPRSRHNNSGKVDPRNVAFQADRVTDRHHVRTFRLNAKTA